MAITMTESERRFLELLAGSEPLSAGGQLDLAGRLLDQLTDAVEHAGREAKANMKVKVEMTFIELATLLGILQRDALAQFGIRRDSMHIDPTVEKLFDEYKERMKK